MLCTGPLGSTVREQALLLLTREGAFLITGCSHPGLERFVSFARQRARVIGVMGGFHGFNDLDLLGSMRLICPCHCTALKEEIMQTYPDRTVRWGVGLSISLPP
jgi:7,8-dihydropterin-6-yl-methyl-4-(beta-D-ribofuranosyl)aminobenzene 5'-phosphate synthase